MANPTMHASQVMSLPDATPLESPAPTNASSPPDASLDHSSLADTSASETPLINCMHTNVDSSVLAQEAAAHVPPLPDATLPESPVLPPPKRPKMKKNESRSAKETST